MEGSWWKDEKDLHEEQKAVINLPMNGRYIVVGPPGSGKTNLLLLRLKWLSVAGKKNVLFLTLGRSLAEFIKTGIGPKKIIDEEQVMTFMRWGYKMTADNAPELLKAMSGDYVKDREFISDNLDKITKSLPNGFYDAIAVDEVQDLAGTELKVLERLASRLMVAGDARQSIYAGNGIAAAEEAGFIKKEISFHYRIGRKICSVADTVYPPEAGQTPLLQRCKYDEKKLPSQATPVPCDSLQEQCAKLVENVRIQLKAYPGDSIGVLLPTYKHGIFDAVAEALSASDISELVEYHTGDSRQFPSEKRVFVLTTHSAKGMEFRAVNLVASERMRSGPLGRRTLLFTSVTRAKTSLLVYYTGNLPASLATSFANESIPDIGSVF